jgi:hypothetical protein
LIVGIHVEEHDALGSRRATPVPGRGLERQAADRGIDDTVGPRAYEAAASVGARRVLGDREGWVGQHRKQGCIRLDENELDGAGIRRADFLDDTRDATQEGGPRAARRRGLRTQLAFVANGHVERCERAPIMESHAVAQRERPHEPVLGRRPACGQGRLDIGTALPPCDESVEYLTRDESVDPVERCTRIDGGGHARRSDAKLAPDGTRWCRWRLRERRRDLDRHKDRHQESQNGSDTSRRRRGHRELYTWNPLITPLVSTTEEWLHRVQNLLMI